MRYIVLGLYICNYAIWNSWSIQYFPNHNNTIYVVGGVLFTNLSSVKLYFLKKFGEFNLLSFLFSLTIAHFVFYMYFALPTLKSKLIKHG